MNRVVNAFLTAIITNRTLLWKYDNVYNPGSLQECDKIIRRATWIAPHLEGQYHNLPKYRQSREIGRACQAMAQQHGIDNNDCIPLLRQTDPTRFGTQLAQLSNETMSIQHKRLFTYHKNIMGCTVPRSNTFGWWGRFNMSDPLCSAYMNTTFSNELIDKSRIEALFQYGMYFLYGALFRHFFTFSDELLASVQKERHAVNPNAITIGVHSRHTFPDDDGANVQRETVCLQHMLTTLSSRRNQHSVQNNNNNTTTTTTNTAACQILIMSDRAKTDQALVQWAQTQSCEGLTAPHDFDNNNNNNTRHRALRIETEHGPFKGAGFFQDWSLVSLGQDGFLGTPRSSSAVVLESMAYNTFRYHWKGRQAPSPWESLQSLHCLLTGPVCTGVDWRY